MICVTRIKGQRVALNPDAIESVEETPDTHVRLTNGETILVRESLNEIIELVAGYRRFLIAAFGTDPMRLLSSRPKYEEEDEDK